MRSFKFRAWDIDKMEMNENLDAPIKDGGIINMQFTGICDRGGIPIYEGDITKTPNRIGIVSYHNARAMFIIQDGFNEPLYQFAPMVDVIGNVHENPELLK